MRRVQGFCRTCGASGPLTDDHVPPKAAWQLGTVELRLLGQSSGRRGKLVQGGLKFRTLCARCNNHLLGSLYDPQLAKFARGVAAQLLPLIRGDVIGPHDFRVKADPHLVAKR